MSNSVVKVTDSMLNDSLLLLVGEDGTVTPNKDVVEAYLNAKSGSTNLQVMHINKSDDQSVEVAVDNMLYVPDAENEYVEENSRNVKEIAHNLYNIKLDHDYTPHCEPPEEIDELAKTLSILDGGEDNEMSDIAETPNIKNTERNDLNEINILSMSNCKSKAKLVSTPLKTSCKTFPKKIKTRPKCSQEKDNNDYYEDQLDYDSDYEWEENKQKKVKKNLKPELKKDKLRSPKTSKPREVEMNSKVNISPTSLSMQETKFPEKKQMKKEKRLPKPIPDDFALFSTPDIIRRVGGRETNVSTSSSELCADIKPAKIEARSKSVTELPQTSTKQSRLSLDGKITEKSPLKSENKGGDRKLYVDSKTKRNSLDGMIKKSPELPMVKPHNSAEISDGSEQMGVTDVHSVISDVNKSFSGSLALESQDLGGSDQNMALDGTGLDLDPTLLENINSDLISEDILYEVAQSLVSNTDLQNAIDKSLSEDNLVLESAVQHVMEEKHEHVAQNDTKQQDSSILVQRGTQIVRPDGRIVVIPPIERPATRSRNKKKEIEKQMPKGSRKPLDEEHVSGNELDSSEEDEEESEDDPNKLWCICNQPHNNRFMICCDTCEEWYHGKCVNITKAMGQQMESEGREWICLFCKDPLLRRPQAAARRIRKASRNSRQSSDSAGSVQIPETSSGSVPCVVCQKPSRSNSIFCSETCILAHAQGVERVVVFERSTGNMLTGNRAPSAANLEQWLKEHPGYEVVRSAGKIVTTKQTSNMGQSKLKLLKSVGNDVPSSPTQNKVVNVATLKHLQKNQQQLIKSPPKQGNSPGFKVVSKHVPTSQLKHRVQPSLSKEPTVSTPSKVKILHSSVKNNVCTSTTKEKSVPMKVPKVRQSEQSSSTPQTKQENIRENVQKTVFEQLTNRLKMAEDLTLSEEELKNISIEIESQLYKCFGDTGQKYRNKYRSLIFNIKDIKNQTLWRRICEKSINPYQLVRLSPDDLASQELALWREREAKHQLDMIKKSELELLKCNRQYVLKTHKGEQILEDNRPTDSIDNSEVITSLTDGSNGEKVDSKKDSSRDGDKKSSKHNHKERKSSRGDSKEHRSHRSSSKDRSRKRSRSRDRNSKHVDRKRSKSRSRDRHRRSSHKSSRHKKNTHRGSSTDKLDKKSKEILEQLVDNKIVPPLEDRLWKHVPQEDIMPTPLVESDSDHEPTSTVTIPTPPHNNELDDFAAAQLPSETKSDKKFIAKEKGETEDRVTSPVSKLRSEEIWRGVINMIDVAQISITAHEVSGDCSGLGVELPTNLDIVGRISPDTVWDYIGKMKCSNSKIISVVRLNAINIEEKMPYLALYSYLSSRNRLGVVKSTNRAVKDFYILPLASQKPIPQALLPINGPGFEEARPALLLGILVRDKRKRPLLDSVSPIVSSIKKTKTEPLAQATPPSRSYTPPPIKDPRLKLPFPPAVTDQDDEPYSPEDSDPDSVVPSTSGDMGNSSSISSHFLEADVTPSQTFQPFVNKFDDIPGLDNATLPSSTQEIQRQMEKLNKEIEMQKSEINSISQNIATASTEIGTSALANIALPSNLQQILDSIKTIGSAASLDTLEMKPTSSVPLQENSDLTIPLMLPTTFSRHSATVNPENTIPLNLPNKKKSPTEPDKSSSVLSSLSEEDLIRKAEEMLEGSTKNANFSAGSQRIKVELDQPPVPGLEDEKI
ncbi:death-inducer obliterator 1 [Asbolus verrucosus]|uniref:Death-inducer obliterator 1 n=1 Tax=Asbolus verrucosus TaxID=1661398 RepID=A0A482WCW0_ASBVE|nr:death-inducer obliterator 1 [Asbolus verrucosus]